MISKANIFYTAIIAIIFSFTANGQDVYWELGFGGGVSSYWGDLKSDSFSDNFRNPNAGGNLFLRYNYERFAGRLMLTVGKISGSDKDSRNESLRQRNLDFFSPITEGALLVEYNIFGLNPKDDEAIFTPHLTLGVGFVKFDPKTTYNGNKVRLQPLGTEGQTLPGFPEKYKLTEMVIPMGGGLKFKINRNLVGSIELLGRVTFTDYLDDVSTNYAFFDELLVHNGQLSANLSQRFDEYLGEGEGSNANLTNGGKRGGADVNDYYFTFYFNLSYNLGSKLSLGGRSRRGGGSCPRF